MEVRVKIDLGGSLKKTHTHTHKHSRMLRNWCKGQAGLLHIKVSLSFMHAFSHPVFPTTLVCLSQLSETYAKCVGLHQGWETLGVTSIHQKLVTR